MPIDIENDTTVNEAMERLAAAEAAETQPPSEAFEQADNGELQQPEADSKEVGDKQPDSLTDGTLATADKTKADAPKNDETQKTNTGQKGGDDKDKSQFKKAIERGFTNWKEFTEWRDKTRTELTTKDQSLTQREQVIAQREQKAQLAEAKAKRKFTPEEIETHSADKMKSAEQLSLQADGLDKRADEFEKSGEYGKSELAKKQAQDLREQAAGEKYSAKQLKDMAEKVRKEPADPTIQQHQDLMDKHLQHYTMEAAKVWPDLAVNGSEFQKQVIAAEQTLLQSGLNVKENPSLRYFAAQFVNHATTAARVPQLVKDLGALQAKVKELEAFTAPSGGNGATQKIEQIKSNLSDEDEAAELRAMALARS